MAEAVIITAALTGAGASTSKSPYVPVTPMEIADEAIAAASAGAAIVHIHVRDPVTKAASSDLELYAETVGRIRESGTDVLINLTTGVGARFVPDETDPSRGGPGTSLSGPLQRVHHVVDLKPDICSLDVATMNFGEYAFLNIPRDLRLMAAEIKKAGVKPELEVFELGHIRLAAKLAEEGLIDAPSLFQLCLGIPWGAPATAETMISMQRQLPHGAIWSSFGISRANFTMAAQAVILGGHVRTGLEDNLYMGPGVLARSNGELVERVVQIVEVLGATIASPSDARRILHL